MSKSLPDDGQVSRTTKSDLMAVGQLVLPSLGIIGLVLSLAAIIYAARRDEQRQAEAEHDYMQAIVDGDVVRVEKDFNQFDFHMADGSVYRVSSTRPVAMSRVVVDNALSEGP